MNQVPNAGLKTPLQKEDWYIKRFKYLFKKLNRPVRDDDGIVTAFRDGLVTLRSNRRKDGFTFADKEIGYQGVEPNDLVIHAMDGFAGAIGVSDSRGKCSPVYSIAIPITPDATYPRFWGYYLRNLAISGFIESLAKGIRERSTDFRWKDVSNLLVNFPNYEIQKGIADFLDRETDLINQLIEKKEIFLLKASKRIESLVDKAISCPRVSRIRFENVTQRMQRTVNLAEYDELIRLGLYNRGRGIFKKPAADEEGMGDSRFFFVEPGDLILSGQFSWEGAVALATSKEDGCVVSHRYPIYRGKGSVNTAYLFGLLRSNFGDFILNEASRGSAGRNRPLNTWRLGKEKIPVPDISLQKEIEQAVIFERRLREKTQRSINILEEFRTSLITEAITGQLDIELWKKRCGTNVCLDNIEEKMRA
ncbi:TPA: hypothetical protein NR303_000359 [Legionella pneumophila]|nr:hypothetical protein [Legionella pneumophila]HCJ4284455.1 hypothetical protein [Legionella pneumophila]